MLKANYEILEKKLEGFDSLPVGEKYLRSEKLYKTLEVADTDKINSVLKETGVELLYKSAEQDVMTELKKDMKIVSSKARQLNLLYPNEKKDAVISFFEVSNLADKLGKSNLEKSIIIGFFMNEERMNIIQIFNHLSPKISAIVEG